jgi:threonine/homoserine/homoserine lactone efflux protein
MAIEVILAFVAASFVLAVVPGPVVTLTIANSLAYGTRAGAVTVLGTALGSSLLLLAGGIGMAWLLALLADWFTWLRLAGAAYLIWLGARHWRAGNKPAGDASPRAKASLFWHGVLVAVTNPKTILFYAAFFPQFMDPSQPAGPQIVLLSVLFLVTAHSTDMGYALLAGRVRPYLVRPEYHRLRNRISGVLLIATGAALAFARRA